MPTITYAPNPLWSVVTLNETDAAKLRAGIIEDWTEDGAVPTDKFVGEQIVNYTMALSGGHSGDCTCVPCTCCKCAAEGYLGITTIAGLYKHEASKVDAAFNDGRNIHEAVEWLAAYAERMDATPDDKKYDGKAAHIAIWNSATPRWKVEAERAHAWLMKYRDQHFLELPVCAST